MDTKKGQVTIRLPYPVFIDSITIDHVFGDLVPKDMIQSAPKEIRVFGYPACSNKLEDCYALGFDDTDPMEIARVDYDIEGPTFQNFDTIFATKTDTSVLGNDSEIEDDAGSCSSEKMTSCSSPPKRSFGGVTLKIYDNWGNDEYTCLYRVRVHGEPDIY
jgi:SUN domain-containing protein 1/2